MILKHTCSSFDRNHVHKSQASPDKIEVKLKEPGWGFLLPLIVRVGGGQVKDPIAPTGESVCFLRAKKMSSLQANSFWFKYELLVQFGFVTSELKLKVKGWRAGERSDRAHRGVYRHAQVSGGGYTPTNLTS